MKTNYHVFCVAVALALACCASGCSKSSRDSSGKQSPKDQHGAVDAGKIEALAKGGDAEAQFRLGAMYQNGEGVKQDYSEASKWFRQAADKGYPEAQLIIGAMYFNGKGVPKDLKEAVTWFRRAAEQGNTQAQNSLGILYGNGMGVPKDFVQAHMWFSLAAQGNQLVKANIDKLEPNMTAQQIESARKLAREWKPTPPQYKK